MPFLSLSFYNFRNLKNDSIDLSSKEVFFCGENGQGKSNLLESLYYSSYGSSFRTHVDVELIRKNEKAMSLKSMFMDENGSTHYTVIKLEKGEKNKKYIEKDTKAIKNRKELVNTMPCVLYNHDDLEFILGEPERRRFFIDQSLSMYDVLYIDLLMKYRKILKNRNFIIKEKKSDLLEKYHVELVNTGLEIQKKRKDAIFKFNQIFGKIYEEITGIEGISIKYGPSWNLEKTVSSSSVFSDSQIPGFEDVLRFVESKRELEILMGTTVSGPHRDRINFIKDKVSFVPMASTGQRRLLALILRNAQAVYYKQITGKKPVLLMDDVLLELDPEKRKKFSQKLPDYEQLFCTFLPGENWQNYVHNSTKVYSIENGEWSLSNER